MRYIYTADIHGSSYSQDKIISESNLPVRLHSIKNVMIEMIEYGLKNNIPNLIIGGDLFHNKSIIHSIAQSLFLDIVRSYRQIKFIILDGNHDMSSMTGDGVSATKCFDNEENVITIHETKLIENILFVPWNPKTMYEDIKHGKEDYLISHFGLNEGKLNSGISIISDLGLKDVKQYKRCYLGHYHLAQEIANVIYVGDPLQLDWGEKNEIKRFLAINSETGEEKSIITKGYTKYIQFEITKENKNEIIEQSKLLKNEGHYVKINKFEDFDTSDIENDFNIINKKEIDITNRGITSSMSDSAKLDRYLAIKEIPEGKREIYKRIALEIINSINGE